MLIGLIIRPIDLNRYLNIAIASATSSEQEDTPTYELGSDRALDAIFLEDINDELNQYLTDYRYDVTTEHYCDEIQSILSLILNTAITETDLIFNLRFPDATPEIVGLTLLNTRGDVAVKWSVRTMLTLQPQV